VAAFVEIDQLGKSYPTPHGLAEIVRDFTLDVGEGEFVCIVGHSGCGKSTVLSIVMGLNLPSSGGVAIAGREVDGPGTDRGVVFQSATLLPWMSVRANVRLALDQVRRSATPADADAYLTAVGLEGWASAIRVSCRRACSSASASRGRLPSSRASCCWTSRSRCSTR
jgi:ABC-type nitrate/sulfonate/bicarbonate transport system ATPase subunit